MQESGQYSTLAPLIYYLYNMINSKITNVFLYFCLLVCLLQDDLFSDMPYGMLTTTDYNDIPYKERTAASSQWRLYFFSVRFEMQTKHRRVLTGELILK